MNKIIKEYVRGSKQEEANKKKILWVDFETTGLDKDKHAIITAGIIVDIGGEEYEKNYLTCVPYGVEVSDNALKINNIELQTILKHEHTSYTLYKEIQSILNRYINRYDSADKFYFAGYNSHFDKAFLAHLWQLNCWKDSDGKNYFGSYFHGGTIDLLAVANFLYASGKIDKLPDEGHKLSDLAKHFNIPIVGEIHNALTDIEVTKKIYELFVKEAFKLTESELIKSC